MLVDWRIPDAVGCDFNGTDLQRLCVNAQMHLAPLAPVIGPMFLALPLTFAQHLDASAIDQQVQRLASALMRQRHLQMLLAPTQGAEISNTPIQTGQIQQALDHAGGLAQSLTVQILDHQAELNGCFRERRGAPPLAIGFTCPFHVLVDPQHQ